MTTNFVRFYKDGSITFDKDGGRVVMFCNKQPGWIHSFFLSQNIYGYMFVH